MNNQIVKFLYFFTQELCFNGESFFFINNNINSNDIYSYLLILINLYTNIFTYLVINLFIFFYFFLRLIVSINSQTLANVLSFEEFNKFLLGNINKK